MLSIEKHSYNLRGKNNPENVLSWSSRAADEELHLSSIGSVTYVSTKDLWTSDVHTGSDHQKSQQYLAPCLSKDLREGKQPLPRTQSKKSLPKEILPSFLQQLWWCCQIAASHLQSGVSCFNKVLPNSQECRLPGKQTLREVFLSRQEPCSGWLLLQIRYLFTFHKCQAWNKKDRIMRSYFHRSKRAPTN